MRTGRPPKSDAEKKRSGTLDPRWTEEARLKRAEQKVVSLFGADQVNVLPEPPAGLSEKAAEEFRLWTRRLHEQERLSQIWVEKITFYAIRKHKIIAALEAGKMPSSEDTKGCDMFLKELNALNIDAPRGPVVQVVTRSARTAALSRLIGKRS